MVNSPQAANSVQGLAAMEKIAEGLQKTGTIQ